jgi:hypothetical protein
MTMAYIGRRTGRRANLISRFATSHHSNGGREPRRHGGGIMMNPPNAAGLRYFPGISVTLSLVLVLACSPPVQRPTGPARDYEDAKVLFKRGNFDKAIEYTEGLATASPPTSYTERARVLRAIIFIGRIKAYKELAEAYTKGVESAKNSHFKAAYGEQRHDNLQFGARSALGLGETAHQLLQASGLPKQVTLEAPFPSVEGPVEVRDLLRVSDGGWIEPEQQEAAAVDAVRKGIDDALAGAVQGDRSKARSALSAGPVQLDGVDFALYLGAELLEGASMYDRKHIHDPQKLRLICNEADGVAKAAQALLKENPDKDKEKEVKRLQEKIKSAEKNL